MLHLAFPPNLPRPFRLLCLGAHADDIEIGCGGTVLRLVAEIPDLSVCWIVFSGHDARETEARRCADAFLSGCKDRHVEVLQFRDGYFPFEGAAIKDRFEALKREFEPALVLTHWRNDAHQDHRLIAELTGNTFRDHLVLAYEIPKYDNDLGNPNFFVPLTGPQMEQKTRLLASGFPSQSGRGWFTSDTFMAMARLRGVGCKAPDGLAEGFYAEKIVW
jgi:LmbE family N-acetylglucosaminyl deacetylase